MVILLCYSKYMKGFSLSKLGFAIVLPFIAGGIGSLFTMPAIATWYAELAKPFFNPPNWVFGPVWTTLYLLQGIAFYLILTSKAKQKEKNFAVALFLIQLVLNSLWSIVFFGMKNVDVAVGVIVMLFVFLILTIVAFSNIKKSSAFLLIPYIAWVSFASILNIAIAILN